MTRRGSQVRALYCQFSSVRPIAGIANLIVLDSGAQKRFVDYLCKRG